MERQIKKSKFAKNIMLFFCPLLILYLVVSTYFIKHFYFGSEINCINISGKTEEEAQKEILSKIKTYTLTIEGRDNMKEKIKGSDIELNYDLDKKIKELKNSENPLGWGLSLLKPKKYETPEIVSYNEEALKNYFNKFSCLDIENIIEPKNPILQYTENGYLILNEVYGNKINQDKLYENIINSINIGKTKINLESINCYENPKYTSNSVEVKRAKDILDKYTSLTITYAIGDKTEVIDGSIIHNWIKVNEDFAIVFSMKDIGDYVNNLANTYNTAGKTRDFLTSLGTTVKVSGGTYGWLINKQKEVDDLIRIIKEGESVVKEPIYKQTALRHGTNDIGDTYVEIDMTGQHLWFYKNGRLMVQGDVVTGNINRGCKTPEGVYMLQYKEKNATLKGENYRTSVKFWMPFYGNVGIHDASWRSNFGGTIYKTNGSHGCVNAPSYLAKVIFDNIEAGTPIICYSKGE